MEELNELENEQVTCARCGREVCKLSVIPQIAGECSTMEGIQLESDLGLDRELVGTDRIQVQCDWIP